MDKLYCRVSYLLTVFCCFAFQTYAQNNLPSQATARKSYDTSRVRELVEKAKNYENSLPDSATYYFEKARALALKMNYERGLSNYYSQYIRFLNYKAEFEEALSRAKEHIDLGRESGDSNAVMLGYNEVANEQEYLSDFQSATTYYLKALKLAVQLHNEKVERVINNNLASVFISLNDYKTAHRYSETAYHLALKAHDTTVMGDCLINMGVSEIHQKEFEQALMNFGKAKNIGYKERDMTLVADALSDKGLVFYNLHQLMASQQQYQQQENIAVKYDLPYEQLYALFQLSVVSKAKGDMATAEKYATRAIAIGEHLNTESELMEMYDTMAVIKTKLGKLTEAMAYKNKFEAMKDKLMNTQIQTNIHHLELQYRSAEKDKQIAQQALKIERTNSALQRKNTLIWTILAGVLALITILVLSFGSYRHKQKLIQQQLITLQKEHEVNTLKAKMQAREEERGRIGREMHDDIGSALTTILYLSEELKNIEGEKNSKQLKSITDTATSIMDKMNEIIWSMNREYDTLDDLVAYTRQHAVEFLQCYNLQYEFEIPEEIPVARLSGEQRRNIYLVVKEALHNIVKHASASKVFISFQLNGNLSIKIHDNGKGINDETVSRFGNGLKNMQHRMESIGGNFEMVNNGGTTIYLKCPLEEPALNQQQV